MPINLRQERGTQDPAQKGEGATYFIPAQDLPEGIAPGEKQRVIIEGLVNKDEQGIIIDVDRIFIEKIGRTDPLQDKIEKGFEAETEIKK